MKSLKGTETEQNLLKSFAGESQARMRYTMFSKQAQKDGFEQIAAIFLETAEQEAEHAKKFFSYLEGGMVEITAGYPAGKVGTTAENLLASAQGEHDEWEDVYPHFAEVADKEGFDNIAATFRKIANVEAAHEKRYRRLLERVEKQQVFARDEEITWQCRKCGYVFHGKEAPKACPVCAHPQAYFEAEKQNY
ncbi:MAG: rubrerythrin family protein [Paludibacter sp.]|nr:rubrerythrin family protein [Paludibacter sp.]